MKKLIELFKYNKKWNLALWVGIVSFIVITLLSVQNKHNQLQLKSISVNIEPKEELAFLDSLKVIELIKGNDTNSRLIDAKRSSLNMDAMETALEKYPFIEKADVALDLSGKLILKIMQRTPVLRIINNKGESYYVAKNGFKMPLHSGFAPHVLIANGNIAESLADSMFIKTKIGNELLKIANFCNRNEFWHSQIEQMYVDNYMDILLIPKVGNHTIVFGTADKLENKFEMLKTFYLKGLNVVGWEKYHRINLKFEGQIVAGE